MLITFAHYTESGDLLFSIMTCKITLHCYIISQSYGSITDREIAIIFREACWCLKEFCNEESFLQQLMMA